MWCEELASLSSVHLFFLLRICQGLTFPFHGLLLISIGCIGKNILLKLERFWRPIPSEQLPFCCVGLRLLAHFHAPLKLFMDTKVCWYPVLTSSNSLVTHTQKAAPPESLNEHPVCEHTVASGKDSFQKVCFFPSFLIVYV